jgi:hypothetical protein
MAKLEEIFEKLEHIADVLDRLYYLMFHNNVQSVEPRKFYPKNWKGTYIE